MVTLLRLALGAAMSWRGTHLREVRAWPDTGAPELYLTRHGREAFWRALSGLLRAVAAARTPEATAARFEALRGALALAGDGGDSPPVVAGPETARAVSGEAYRAVLPLLAGWHAEAAGSTPAPALGAIRIEGR